MPDVQVGYVARWKPETTLQAGPFDSQVGGLPCPFAGTLAESNRCVSCGQPLIMFMQLYAPAETERNIILYGCNNSSCYIPGKVLGSWAVVRTQTDTAVESNGPVPVSMASQPAAAAEDDGGWGSSGAWGSDSGFEAATAALESLTLTAHEVTQVAIDRRKQAQAATVAAASATQEATDTPHFPRFRITSCPEPWEDGYGEDEDDVEDMAADGGQDSMHVPVARQGGDAAVEDDEQLQHARRLWEAYQAREAAEASAPSAAGSAPSLPPELSGEADEDEDEEEEEEEQDGRGPDGKQREEHEGDAWREPHAKDSRRAAKLIAGRKHGGGDKRAGSERRRLGGGAVASRGVKEEGGKKGGGGGGDGGDKYEAVPVKYRYSLAFQRRVALLPEQVVRYDWDGQPLWPTAPPLLPGRAGAGGRRGLQVPPCPRCGARRKFELQLMPGLLFGLKPEEYSTAPVVLPPPPSTAAAGGADGSAHAAGGSPLVLPGGMDWQSVLVYSCESSCGGPGVYPEWCYVVPPDSE